LIAGLFILKHTHSLSDDVLCARWLENPHYQHFCGEQVFRHELPFDWSFLTRWRQRLGEEHLAALLQESLSVAHKTGALETKDVERVAADTTVQPKAGAHQTDARLMYRAIEKLVALAPATGGHPSPHVGGRHGLPLDEGSAVDEIGTVLETSRPKNRRRRICGSALCGELSLAGRWTR
jgi:hypothetical protein